MAFDPSLLSSPLRAPPPPPSLSATQRAQLDELVAHFGDPDFTLPVVEGSEKFAELSEREMMFLETMLRFLRATSSTAAAIGRLERSVLWRRTARIDDVGAQEKEVESESRMGKHFILGFSPDAQPVMYLFPNRNTLPMEQRRPTHAVFVVERAMDLMTAGTTKTTLIVNFSGKRQSTPSSPSTAREALNIMTQHYPETLGVAVLQDIPWVVRAFVSLCWPFIDTNTKNKIKFLEGKQLIDGGFVGEQVLIKDAGGTLDVGYNHDRDWHDFLQLCRERRTEHARRWRLLGDAKVGREERLFKLAPGDPETHSDGEPLSRIWSGHA